MLAARVQCVEDIKPLKTIICSDSSSTLLSLKNTNHTAGQTFYKKFQIVYTEFKGCVKPPAHIGIEIKEKADKMAKATQNPINFTVCTSKSEAMLLNKN